MHCPQQLMYVIRYGDTLWQLARRYKTTVPMILSYNPNLEPYHLQVGSKIIICPGRDLDFHTDNIKPFICPEPYNKIELINKMRLVWEQHVYWTRMLIISIAERLNDQEAVTNRLMQNPKDIASVFADYYPDAAEVIQQLLTEHLQIGAELITALRDKKEKEAEVLKRQWYENADKMAKAFSNINPYYNEEDLRKMLYTHLDLTTQVVEMRLAGNYTADIKAFNEVEEEAMFMADYFVIGIMRQFPQNFQ